MKKIIVAPLNWGLGHATRCIPLIHALINEGFEVILASDGPALNLLRKEFPQLEAIELPSYRIVYPKHGIFLKWKMLSRIPHFLKTMKAEKRALREIIDERNVSGIISDGRFGARSSTIPSVYITHQLNVLSGSTSYVTTLSHRHIIKKFDVCWVPDVNDKTLNHSGKLGHLGKTAIPTKYFGISSRMKKRKEALEYDILVLISGPEPQRSLFEEMVMKQIERSKKRILVVRGIVQEDQEWVRRDNLYMVNFMQSRELEEAINKSEIIISRPGYSTIMDLSILEKKAYFIPTPGQYEQEYLAKRLKALGIAPSCSQKRFRLENLNEVAVYRGLRAYHHPKEDFSSLFSVFQSE